ncbi:hypothetical protein GG851_23520 [Bordetella petrii]|nr:hypothetical protein [Bordetella petrii]
MALAWTLKTGAVHAMKAVALHAIPQDAHLYDALPLLAQGLLTGAFIALACSAAISFAISRAWPYAWLGLTALAAAVFHFMLGPHSVGDLAPGLHAWASWMELWAGPAMALCFVSFVSSLACRESMSVPLLPQAVWGTAALAGLSLLAPWLPPALAELQPVPAIVLCVFFAAHFLKLRGVVSMAGLLGTTSLIILLNLIQRLAAIGTPGAPLPAAHGLASPSAPAYLATALLNLAILALWLWQTNQQCQVPRLAKPRMQAKEHLRVSLEVNRQTSALNQALACAQEKNVQKIQTLSYVGHDLRAPLATIRGYVRLLRDSSRPPKAEHLDAIERSVAFQLMLIDDVLDYAKAELQPLHLAPSSTSLTDLLGEVVAYASMLGRSSHNKFVYAPAAFLPAQVEIDSRRLRQVLLNLLSNAAKFTQNGTIRLVVRARRDSQASRWHIHFCVEDDGIGIELGSQASIFDAFTQLERASGGVGLGLFIAERVVAGMGGKLGVRSAPAEGSAFHFEIAVPELDGALVPAPRASADAGQAAAAEPAPAMRVPPTPARLELAILARDGRLTDIEDWLARIVNFHPGFDAYYAEVRQALLALDLMRLEALALQQPRPE